MRRSLVIGTGFILLLISIGLLDSVLLHPLPSPGGALPASQPEERNAEGDRQRILDILAAMQFTAQESSDDALLRQLAAGDDIPVHALVLLAENDRSALLAWIESPDAGPYFSALKEALSASFSPDLTDLRDDREEFPENRTRDILSFRDRALSAERITIVHTGNTLYELHIADGQEERINALIDALTTD